MASHPAWWVIAALGVAVALLGLLTTTPWADRTARRTASLFREGSARNEPEPRYEPEKVPAG